jgi:hypothetical protein
VSYTRDLLTGLAQYLTAAGVGTYRSTGTYLGTDTAIIFGPLPPTPDRCVALTAYASTDDAAINLSQVRVQFYLRGTPGNTLDVVDLNDSLFIALQCLTNRQYGTAYLSQARRVSTIPMGIDDSLRSEISANYELDVNTPATVGRPG